MLSFYKRKTEAEVKCLHPDEAQLMNVVEGPIPWLPPYWEQHLEKDRIVGHQRPSGDRALSWSFLEASLELIHVSSVTTVG